MCLGELGVVEQLDGDLAWVRTDRGLAPASILLVPHVHTGDHVVLHSGHVLATVTDELADQAQGLRATPPEHDLETTP